MGPLPPTIIIGNKTDLRHSLDKSKYVTPNEGEAFTKYFIQKLGIPAVFHETSAKTGSGIQDAFTQLLQMMSDAEEQKERDFYTGP